MRRRIERDLFHGVFGNFTGTVLSLFLFYFYFTGTVRGRIKRDVFKGYSMAINGGFQCYILNSMVYCMGINGI